MMWVVEEEQVPQSKIQSVRLPIRWFSIRGGVETGGGGGGIRFGQQYIQCYHARVYLIE